METPGLEIRRVKFLQKSGLKKLFAVIPFLFGKVILTGESDPYRINTGSAAAAPELPYDHRCHRPNRCRRTATATAIRPPLPPPHPCHCARRTSTAAAIPAAAADHHPITPSISPPCTVPQRDRPTETRESLRSTPVGV